MKELTQEEFIDRTQAVARARRIFINSGVTNNISDAFALYQEVVSETTREIFLSTAVMGHRRPARFDKFERPKCPEDGFDMMFRNIPENREGIKVQLVCTNPDHTGEGSVLNSENDLAWWQKELKIKKWI